MFTRNFPLRPRSFTQISNLANAVSITNGPTNEMVLMLWSGENQAIRWRDDGQNPTNAVGNILPKDTPFWYYGDPSKVKWIEGASSAKLNITLYH